MDALVERLGLNCTPPEASKLDSILEEYIEKKQWSSPTYSPEARQLIAKGLLAKLSDDTLRITAPGLSLSSYWPAVEECILHYWSSIERLLDGRDRSGLIQVDLSKYPTWIIDLVHELVIRHSWFGREFKREGTKFHVNAPFYIRRTAGNQSLVEKLRRAPEIFGVYDDNPNVTLSISRPYSVVRSLDRQFYEKEASHELTNILRSPIGCPRWLERIIDEFTAEGDMALRGGAPVASIVIYGGIAETLLGIRYNSERIPRNSPQETDPKTLFEIFKIKSLIESAEHDEAISNDLLHNLRTIRDLRNTIHPNKYSDAIAAVGLGDALYVRKSLRELVDIVETSINSSLDKT